MPITLWSLLVAALLPYIWFGLAAPLRTLLFAVGMVCAVVMYLVAGHVL
jgi:uncharacterized MAPEG superfamily protein